MPPAKPTRFEKVTWSLVTQLLPGMFLAYVIVSWCEVMPPWYVNLVAMLGATGVVVCHAFEFDRTAIGIACVAAPVAINLCLWPVVHVRSAVEADKVHSDYLGHRRENFTARNIAIVNGSFTLAMRFKADLYCVSDGRVQWINGFAAGRSWGRIPHYLWTDLHMTMALVKSPSKEGSITELGCWGYSSAHSASAEIATTVNPLHSRLAGGFLLSGQSRILYVEGDVPFQLRPDMTVESFAESNKGHFYVVCVKLRG